MRVIYLCISPLAHIWNDRIRGDVDGICVFLGIRYDFRGLGGCRTFAVGGALRAGYGCEILGVESDECRAGLDDGLRCDAIGLVVGHLFLASAACLLDGELHGVCHLVGIHDHHAVEVSGRTADGLGQ